MKKATAIIVDDERPARKELAFLLKSFPQIEVAGESETVGGAVVLIETLKPEVVFLDIQMAGENGFDLLERAPGGYRVIFVTAFDAYAIRAFEVNAADYLLKPVDPARLELSVRRIFNTTGPPPSGSGRFQYSDLLYVRQTNNTSRFIRLDAVIAIQSVGNYTRLTAKDGRTYLMLKTLKQWEEVLPEKHFVRIHRAAIVNVECIARIEKHSGNRCRVHLLHLEEPLEVSRNCASTLKQIGRQR